MKHFEIAAVMLIAALSVSLASSSMATTLAFSPSAALEGSLTNQELAGVYPASDVGANNGEISTWVVNDPSLDSSGYIFIYQVENAGVDAIDQVELTGFTSSQVVGTGTYSGISGSVSLPSLPYSFTPSSSGNFGNENTFGGTATFEEGDLPNGGTPSYFLVVDTDVTYFSGDYAQMQDNFTAVGNILAPVPEPSSVLVLLVGSVSVYCLSRYRRSSKGI